MATNEIVARDVVGVRLPAGRAWRDIVEAVWSAGAVVFPIDPRQPPAASAELLARARPTIVIDGDGRHRPPDGLPAAEGCAVLMATSGTSGRARLVELSRAAVLAAVEGSAAALGAQPGDGWVSVLPPVHIGGLLVLLRAVLGDAPLAFSAPSDPTSIASRPGFPFTSLVPTLLDRALDTGTDLAGYRGVLVGGAALPASLRERAAVAGVRCIATYGLTQSCGGVVYDGRPLPGAGVRIGSGGEIELSGPTLMSSYRGESGPGAVRVSGDGWLRTGDAGTFDDKGRLHVIGRLDDAIVTGGEKVWPAEVEAVLARHPGVREVAVIGTPDSEWGARVVAVVVPAEGSAPTLEALRDFAGARIGRHQAPRELIVVDHLPRTALGKVARAALRRLPAGDVPDGT
jgi:O-succinylbenzoic acid--CoA ligase